MKSIGETVKTIRKIKGYTQSEVYSGIMSRSFGHRFESGENDISATKLFQILDNLSISADEFRFIQNNYQQYTYQAVLQTLMAAYDSHDLQIMGKIIGDYKNSPELNFRSVSAIGEILLETYHSKTFRVTSDIQVLWDQLFLAKAWTIQEIKIAEILLPIAVSLDRQAMIPTIVARYEENCQRYISETSDPFHISDQLAEVDLTLIQIYLNLKDYARARGLRSKVMALKPAFLTWQGRFTQQLVILIWHLYFGSEDEAAKISDALTGIESLYSPVIDHNIFAIIKIRQKLAKQYRSGHSA